MRKLAGVLLRKIGLRHGPSESGRERGGGYYDKAFTDDKDFQVSFYKTPYYPTWVLVVERLRRHGATHIIDVGCGPGQFAAMLADSGFRSYVGFDFSEVALQMASRQAPGFDFRIADARDRASYEGLPCDAVVCMEVLEHIEDDFGVIDCFPAGARCLMTVPNFPWRSHVRHFSCEDEVVARYGDRFDDFTVTRIKGVRNHDDQFFLMDGLKRP